MCSYKKKLQRPLTENFLTIKQNNIVEFLSKNSGPVFFHLKVYTFCILAEIVFCMLEEAFLELMKIGIVSSVYVWYTLLPYLST